MPALKDTKYFRALVKSKDLQPKKLYLFVSLSLQEAAAMYHYFMLPVFNTLYA